MYNLIALLITITTVWGYDCTGDAPTNLKLGDHFIVCLTFEYKSDGTEKTYAFKTAVDQFSALKVSNIKSELAAQTEDITVHVQVQNQSSSDTGGSKSMIIFDASLDVYREVLSFVVGVENGTFTKITLDNQDCSVCLHGDGTQKCDSATNHECFDKGNRYGGVDEQDPKFFISWIGTDADGSHMLSHTKRLSRFTQYSIGSIYQSAKDLFTS